MRFLKALLSRVRSWPRRYTIGGAVVVVIVLVVAVRALTNGGAESAIAPSLAHVTVAPAASLAAGGSALSLVGTATSLNQATILAETSGQLVSLSTSLGAQVGAGQVLGQFENSSQRAAVLQAQGQYDAAVASQQAVSPVDAHAAAVNAYTSAYSTLDTLLHSDADAFFGVTTAFGPQLIITAPQDTSAALSRERDEINNAMNAYQATLGNAGAADPTSLLANAQAIATQVSDFLVSLAAAANEPDSHATAAQLAALSAARTSAASVISTLASAVQTYRSQSVSTSAGASASVTTALGGLRAAQANLEKTIVRSPINGTVVSLPVNQGDYVNTGSAIAIISNPGALEVDVFVTADDAKTLMVGAKATINGTVPGTIVFIAPALDPTTGKIEVKIGLTGGAGALTDGDTVTVALDRAAAAPAATAAGAAIMIPITAAKITPAGPVVFTVASSTLVANPVTFGQIEGDEVAVSAGLTPDMQIVTDARGLSAGQQVVVDATSSSR